MPKILPNQREVFLNNAKKILKKEGCGALSIRRLANDSGVATGTLYNYFRSKEDLIAAVMGGAISSAYAAGHPEKVKGLILMGAYLYGDYPGDRTLVIYGSLNVSVEKHLKGTEHVVRIEGGNHDGQGDR